MAIKVTHELHERRKGRNVGLALILVSFIGIVFGLTVVKVTNGGSLEAYDHVLRPQLETRADQN